MPRSMRSPAATSSPPTSTSRSRCGTNPGFAWCSRCSTHRSSPVTPSPGTRATGSSSNAVPPRGGWPRTRSPRFWRSARSARRTWEATLALVTESERVAQRLVDEGNATPDQVLRARADKSDVEQRLDEARQTEDAAGRAFNRILRRSLDAPVDELPDSVLRFEIALSEEQAVVSALAPREELAQTDAGVRAAEAGVRLASASFLPSLGLALDYGFQGYDLHFSGDDDFAVASVVLSWNLSIGGSDFARRSAARADAEPPPLPRPELEDLVRLHVRQAYDAAVV